MLHLLISSLSPIISTKQTTATSFILFLPFWQILYLSLLFYFPLRINKNYPSNSTTLKFQFLLNQTAATKKLYHRPSPKTLFLPISCILYKVWWFSFGSMTQLITCGKPSRLSITHIRYCSGKKKCPDCFLAQLNSN